MEGRSRWRNGHDLLRLCCYYCVLFSFILFCSLFFIIILFVCYRLLYRKREKEAREISFSLCHTRSSWSYCIIIIVTYNNISCYIAGEKLSCDAFVIAVMWLEDKNKKQTHTIFFPVCLDEMLVTRSIYVVVIALSLIASRPGGQKNSLPS